MNMTPESPKGSEGTSWSAIEILSGLACLTFSGGNPVALVVGGALIAHGLTSRA